jgi:hypothetical protein
LCFDGFNKEIYKHMRMHPLKLINASQGSSIYKMIIHISLMLCFDGFNKEKMYEVLFEKPDTDM